MKRDQLIACYRDMMYRYGEYDIFDDDIEPKLPTMTTKEIHKAYISDKTFFASRAEAGGFW